MTMDKSKLELKVGIFVFIAIVILGAFIFKISDLKNYGSGYPIRFIFSNVAGVKSGSPVRFAGVDVGEVRQVNIAELSQNDKTQIEVVAWIRKSLLIPQGSHAFVSTLGLLGEKYIEIVPPEEIKSFLKSGDKLRGHDPILMHDWINEAQDIIKDFQEITQKLKDGEGTVGKLLYEDKIYQELEALISDLRRHPWKLFWKTREKK
jgi:phospholipid/cholesterol/gamma-HCH transport system substrate-binding protein